jgi:hypothetical protein
MEKEELEHLELKEGQERAHDAAWYPGLAMGAHSPLVARISSIFSSKPPSWPKIIYNEGRDHDYKSWRTTKTKTWNRGDPAKIGGGYATGSHLQPLQQQTFISMMKRE